MEGTTWVINYDCLIKNKIYFSWALLETDIFMSNIYLDITIF